MVEMINHVIIYVLMVHMVIHNYNNVYQYVQVLLLILTMQIMDILLMVISVYKHVHLDYLHFQVQGDVYHHVLLDFFRIK